MNNTERWPTRECKGYRFENWRFVRARIEFGGELHFTTGIDKGISEIDYWDSVIGCGMVYYQLE